MTLESLRDCLAGVPPVRLLGMDLLKSHRPQGGMLPTGVPRGQIKEAVCEIIAYTSRCTTTAQRLNHLASIPLTGVCLEYGL